MIKELKYSKSLMIKIIFINILLSFSSCSKEKTFKCIIENKTNHDNTIKLISTEEKTIWVDKNSFSSAFYFHYKSGFTLSQPLIGISLNDNSNGSVFAFSSLDEKKNNIIEIYEEEDIPNQVVPFKIKQTDK